MPQEPDFLAYLNERRAFHRKALEEIDVAERLYREGGQLSGFPMAPSERSAKPKGDAKKPASKKLMILGIINEGMPQGLTSFRIHEVIRERYLPDFPRGNLMPKLSGYKDDRLLDLQDGVWTISEKGKAFLANG